MPIASVLYKISSKGIHLPPSICSYKPSPAELSLLSKGLNFVPTPRPLDTEELNTSLRQFREELYSVTHDVELQKLPLQLQRKGPLFTSTPKVSKVDNLSPAERQALDALRSNPEIHICPADKNLGVVVCDRKWYLQEAYRQLNDGKTYVRSRQTLQGIQQDVATWASFLDFSSKDQTAILRDLDNTVLPKFYLLPKIHKDPIKGRPIVGAFNAPTTGLSKWVDRQLQKLLPVIPTHISGSLEALQRLNQFRILPRKISKNPSIASLPQGLCLFAADVASLYPSIPQKKGIAAVKEFLRLHAQGSPDPKFRLEEKEASMVLSSLQFVLENNYFTFEGETFHQVIGTAMGTNCAPSFASIFLHQYECSFFHKYSSIFPLVLRFLDDIFGVSLTTPDVTLRLLKTELEQPTHGILLEVTTGLSVPFLDLSISISGDRLSTSLYQKSQNLYLYTPYTSAQPLSVKKGLIKTEVIRYIRSCSQEEDFKRILEEFILRLQARGYPLSFINKVLTTCPPYSDRDGLMQPKKKEKKSLTTPFRIRYAPNAPAARNLLVKLPPTSRFVYLKNRSLLDYLRTPGRPPDH
jgi:hypothetical protein